MKFQGRLPRKNCERFLYCVSVVSRLILNQRKNSVSTLISVRFIVSVHHNLHTVTEICSVRGVKQWFYSDLITVN